MGLGIALASTILKTIAVSVSGATGSGQNLIEASIDSVIDRADSAICERKSRLDTQITKALENAQEEGRVKEADAELFVKNLNDLLNFLQKNSPIPPDKYIRAEYLVEFLIDYFRESNFSLSDEELKNHRTCLFYVCPIIVNAQLEKNTYLPELIQECLYGFSANNYQLNQIQDALRAISELLV